MDNAKERVMDLEQILTRSVFQLFNNVLSASPMRVQHLVLLAHANKSIIV